MKGGILKIQQLCNERLDTWCKCTKISFFKNTSKNNIFHKVVGHFEIFLMPPRCYFHLMVQFMIQSLYFCHGWPGINFNRKVQVLVISIYKSMFMWNKLYIWSLSITAFYDCTCMWNKFYVWSPPDIGILWLLLSSFTK